jgi:hypothetical protein
LKLHVVVIFNLFQAVFCSLVFHWHNLRRKVSAPPGFGIIVHGFLDMFHTNFVCRLLGFGLGCLSVLLHAATMILSSSHRASPISQSRCSHAGTGASTCINLAVHRLACRSGRENCLRGSLTAGGRRTSVDGSLAGSRQQAMSGGLEAIYLGALVVNNIFV